MSVTWLLGCIVLFHSPFARGWVAFPLMLVGLALMYFDAVGGMK